MANESVILTWNPTNWVTIGLMAVSAFALIGLAQKILANRKGASS